ncbi:MAG TPA: hypothetical protein VJX71_17490 [Methylomirabilota bacterium]|nr:hypothetical protein [Methylomirabilota bacterium]
MEVSWFDLAGPALIGDKKEIACIPHKGCRLEIAATATTSDRDVNLLVPGAVIRYKRSFLFGDRFELPSGAKVGLADLLGFKLQLAPTTTPPPPIEEVIVRSLTRRESDRVPVGSIHE